MAADKIAQLADEEIEEAAWGKGNFPRMEYGSCPKHLWWLHEKGVVCAACEKTMPFAVFRKHPYMKASIVKSIAKLAGKGSAAVLRDHIEQGVKETNE